MPKQYNYTQKTGRPTKFRKKLGMEICARISEGRSVREIVKDNKMPSSSTIFRWLLDERYKKFWEQYKKARNIQAELMFEELLEIADDGSNDWVERMGKSGESWWQVNGETIGRSRLRVDTRKWYLSKVLPKKFGEKLDMTSGGEKLAVMPSTLNIDNEKAKRIIKRYFDRSGKGKLR